MDIKELQTNQALQNDKNHPWEMARFEIVNSLVSKYIKNSPITGLDIGCGDIFFLDHFSKQYKGVFFAVDIAFNDEIIEILTNKYQNDAILMTNSFEAAYPDKKIDVVFLLDVIEHIEKPVGFMKEIIQQPYIDENTLFVITVPAYQSMYSNHDYWLGHIKRYNAKVLFGETNEAGLKALHSGNFFFSLVGIRILEKLLEKL